MKTVILALSLTTATAHAQVIQCPAMNRGAPLIGGSMYAGEKKEFELHGDRKTVRNGTDAHYGFDGNEAKWVACWYKPATAHWYRIGPGVQHCELKERTPSAAPATVTVLCK